MYTDTFLLEQKCRDLYYLQLLYYESNIGSKFCLTNYHHNIESAK